MDFLRKMFEWIRAFFTKKESKASSEAQEPNMLEEKVLEEYVDLGVMLVKASPTDKNLSQSYKQLTEAVASFHELVKVSDNLPESLKASAFRNLLRLSQHLKEMIQSWQVSSQQEEALEKVTHAFEQAFKRVSMMEETWRESNDAEFKVSLELIQQIYGA